LANEHYGFVVAVSFIIIFTGLVVAIPSDLQGLEDTVDIVIPVDPSLVTDFTDYEDFQKSDFSGVTGLYYWYDGNSDSMGYDFECDYYSGSNYFWVGAKVYWGGFLWLGAYDSVVWKSDNNTIYTTITFDDIDNDATDGSVRYELTFSGSGKSAGAFIFYYNTTTYSDASSAWTADALFLVHGIGFTANNDIASLLIGLLFLQLPDVPPMINLLLATFLWASVVYVLWFIIKSMIPLLG